MSISDRPLMTRGVVLLTAGAIALAPVVTAPTPSTSQALTGPAAAVSAVHIETVHIENIQLTGIGQDIYYAITPWVQYGVSLVSYGAGFVPIVGPPLADQININYFQGIQPIVAATVNYAAGVVQNPLNFFPTTAAYGNALFGIGYNYVSAQLQFWSLPPLPPIVLSAPAGATARAVAKSTNVEQRKTAQRQAAKSVAGSAGEVRPGIKDSRSSVKPARKAAHKPARNQAR